MLELLADAGPGVLPLWAVVVLAVGMYPLGFLFGACSDCCPGCSNLTCDGFDLDEAYTPTRVGGSGVCGPFNGRPDRGGQYGPYGTGVAANTCYDMGNDAPSLRRSCVRWLCRCYESTGQRQIDPNTGDPYSSDPADWYTVASNTVVGGPTTNDLDLPTELEAAQHNGMPLEHSLFIDNGFFDDPDGTPRCLVWVFLFYSLSDYLDNNPATPRRVITPNDDCYEVVACDRCQ